MRVHKLEVGQVIKESGTYVLRYPFCGTEMAFLNKVVKNKQHLVLTRELDPAKSQPALVVWKSKDELDEK